MLISNVSERAAQSVIDELVMCALTGKFPEHLDMLTDALIYLTEFEWRHSFIRRGNSVPEDDNFGGRLIYFILFTTVTIIPHHNKRDVKKLAKLLVRMCEVNERFKNSFLKAMLANDGGPESYRFELGDMAVYACEQAIKEPNS